MNTSFDHTPHGKTRLRISLALAVTLEIEDALKVAGSIPDRQADFASMPAPEPDRTVMEVPGPECGLLTCAGMHPYPAPVMTVLAGAGKGVQS